MALIVGGLASAARAGTLININTQLGTIQVDLFDDLVPETVNNFLSYVNSGAFANTLVHRSTSIADTGLAVIQGGGFTYNAGNQQFVPITTQSPIALQYNRANTRGTIAMARQTPPNTATSQWFINTTDNSSVLGPTNGGGYAVFGWVVGNGMQVVDAINQLNKTTVSGFTNVPLQNWTSGPVSQNNLVITTSITNGGTHPAFQNPVMNTDINNDGRLSKNDAHVLINDQLAHQSHAVVGPFNGTKYLDPNGSGTVTPADVNIVVSAILAQQGAAFAAAAAAEDASAFSSGPMFASPMLVPEPGSLSLAGVAAVALAAFAIRRRFGRR